MAGLQIPEGTIERKTQSATHDPIRLDYKRFGDHQGFHITEHPQFKEAASRVQDLHALLLEGRSPL